MTAPNIYWIIVLTAISQENYFSQTIHYWDKPNRPDIYESAFDDFMATVQFSAKAIYISYHNIVTGEDQLVTCGPSLAQENSQN
jgi:hypothetical protein